jgi:hypothetical protein
MKFYAMAVILLLLSISNAYATTVEKSEKINELMKIQGLYEIIEQQKSYCQEQAKSIGAKMLVQLKAQFSDLDLSISAPIEKATQRFIEMAKPTWTTEEAVAIFGELYGSNITEDDLDKIISFYKSELGQKDIQATKKAMPLWTKFFAEKNNAILEKASQAYFREIKSIVENEKTKHNE